jgi:NADPH:quinone reductase-like Zn-dependent oxidoreductase
MLAKLAHNSGDDVAGTIAAIGEGVTEFHVGDRVAAFHEMVQPDGAFAEYAIAWESTTFHIPAKTTFEEAATLPLAAMTAAVGMYLCLRLPEPWVAATKKIPLVVYGGSSAVGAFAIKLAQASNVHPVIAVAGGGADYVETLIDRAKGDTIVDYRKGDAAVVEGITQALADNGFQTDDLVHAFDAVSEKGSFQNLSKVLSSKKERNPHITLVLPGADYSDIPSHITHSTTMVGRVHAAVDPKSEEAKQGIKTGGKDFGYVWFRLFNRALAEGWLTAHPYEVIPGGLEGVQTGLQNLKEGKASAIKYLYRISDTKSHL